MGSPTKSLSNRSPLLQCAQGGRRQAVRKGTALLSPLKASANISRPKKHPLAGNVDGGNSRDTQPSPKRQKGPSGQAVSPTKSGLHGPPLIGNPDNDRNIKPEPSDLDGLIRHLVAAAQEEADNDGEASARLRNEPEHCTESATDKPDQPQGRKQAPIAKMHASQQEQTPSHSPSADQALPPAAAEANAPPQNATTNSDPASTAVLATPPATPPPQRRPSRVIPALRKAAAITQPHGSVRFGFLDEGGAYNELDRGKFTEDLLAGILADFKCSLGRDAYVTGIVVRLREGSSCGTGASSSAAGAGASAGAGANSIGTGSEAVPEKEQGEEREGEEEEEEEEAVLQIPCVTYPPGPDDPRLADFVAQPALWERSRGGLDFVVQATMLESWHAVGA